MTMGDITRAVRLGQLWRYTTLDEKAEDRDACFMLIVGVRRSAGKVDTMERWTRGPQGLDGLRQDSIARLERGHDGLAFEAYELVSDVDDGVP